MLGNEFSTGLVAVLIGYLFGSIPSAYLVTKIVTGKDIRKLGGGNVGGLNTLKEVGVIPAVIVFLLDIGKGTAVVLLTQYALHFQLTYVLISACGAVLGHNWMLWLNFNGGKGMGAAVGTITAIFLTYHHPQVLILFFGILTLFFVTTHNLTLSNGAALITLPFICWLVVHSGQFVTWSVIIGLIIAVKFTPTALDTLARTNSWKDIIKGK